MKTLLFIPFLFVCSMVIGQSSKIIGKTTKIGNLMVAQYNFPSQMNYSDAVKACKALGSGWRLPSKDELNLIYQNKDKIGGFAVSAYWTSSESYNNFVSYQHFSNGYQDVAHKDNAGYVRAVRFF